ncbi:hypothetical protein IE53DRAFT_138426 [Violaceomyces palustris]|uniref:Uncharacterized protein n=1 Tax=Violaceomyces palustris TaxID=1673888 RepID=A0ACD0NUU0_9BASI|nr:hypothetical protein IE53DRAFT_138426 [Violaceomyces palustris]
MIPFFFKDRKILPLFFPFSSNYSLLLCFVSHTYLRLTQSPPPTHGRLWPAFVFSSIHFFFL